MTKTVFAAAALSRNLETFWVPITTEKNAVFPEGLKGKILII
jgi:hypothetical protein